MTALTWDAVGSRFYEAGVDRCVLYPTTGAGVSWSGITSINEAVSGGDPKPFYYDGIKFLNVAANEEFQATIQAISAPPEFNQYDGIKSLATGLYVTQQQRKHFGLSYRTLIGNDTKNLDLGYILHIVYGALAAPSSRTRATIDDTSTPQALSWDITTTPVAMTGAAPSAHLMVKSTDILPAKLAAVEALLYGTVSTANHLPTPAELVAALS